MGEGQGECKNPQISIQEMKGTSLLIIYSLKRIMKNFTENYLNVLIQDIELLLISERKKTQKIRQAI